MSFVHLHVHSEYSLLDGVGKIESIVEKAKKLNMNAVALTDHGVMFGAVDFYKCAKKNGIKPIIGCEVYTACRSRFDKDPEKDSRYGHLILLAKNQVGYHNLIKLVSTAYVDGFYRKPRIDTEVLREFSEGLIGLSACISGDIPRLILNNDFELALKKANEFKDIFGKDDFYLEMQNHGMQEQRKVNNSLIEISKQTGLKLVATNDVHYVNRGDYKLQEMLICIQTGTTFKDRPPLDFETDELYLKSEEEMLEAFKDYPDAVYTTQEIADKCNVEFCFNDRFLPKFELPSGENSFDYLKKLCQNGLKERYNEITQELQNRLDYELGVINSMGFTDYFLIVWDLIKYARDNEIPVGPGRGSAAGSIVSYCLKITNIDPIKYGLIFERFLNSERISMPDIDMDFCYERRQEVIDYVTRKYGEDRVAQIITFGTMAARAAVRDVGRVLGMPYSAVDAVAKVIPHEPKVTLEKILENEKSELFRMTQSDKTVENLIEVSKMIEGKPRHASTHAAGVVITDKPVSSYVPLYKNGDIILTQYTMTTLEELGLLKMDFLGLRTLTVIKYAVENADDEIDIDNIPLDDKEVYEMISRGETDGVFQLESRGMKRFLKELKPKCIEDIIAALALYRPGPMDSIPDYVRSKNGKKKVEYLHEKLEPILKVTYGCIVYQEQVMEIVRTLAGFSMGQADMVRRAMSKKKASEMEKAKHDFVYGNETAPGAIKLGIKEETALEIVEKLSDFANYAFNKSHAAAYAYVAYQTAYLVCHYPVCYMAALLSSFMDNTDKITEYIEICRKNNIPILQPSVNESQDRFTVEGNSIRIGLVSVKNVGRIFVNDIINERNKNGDFKNFNDFCMRMTKYQTVNRKAVDSLIKSGALDCLGSYRIEMMQMLDITIDECQAINKREIEGQISFIENEQRVPAKRPSHVPKEGELTLMSRLLFEKDVMGFYVSGHPLDRYVNLFKDKVSGTTFDVREAVNEDSKFKDGDKITIAGILETRKTIITKKGSEMLTGKLEDKFGSCDLVVFPLVYERNKREFPVGAILLINGRINLKENQPPSIICESFVPLDSSTRINKLYIRFSEEKEKNPSVYEEMLKIIKKHKGDIPVVLYYEKEKVRKMATRDNWIDTSGDALYELYDLFGKENVILK